MRCTLEKADIEYSRFSSSCGWALSNQGKASIELKIRLLYVRRNSAVGCLWTSSAILALPSSLKDCLWLQTTTLSYVGKPPPSDFGLANSLQSYGPTPYNKSIFVNIYLHIYLLIFYLSFPGGSVVKTLPANTRDQGPISGLGRSSGGGNVNPHQHSCLENPMDREVWRATVHGVTKESDITEQVNNNLYLSTCLSNLLYIYICFYIHLSPIGSVSLENPDYDTWQRPLLWVLAHSIVSIYRMNPEKAMAPHSSTLAWRIPGMGEPGGPLSMGSHRVGHD